MLDFIKNAESRPEVYFWHTVKGEIPLMKTYFGEYSRVEDSVAMALGLRMGDAVVFTGKINDFSSIGIFAQGPEADYLIKNFKNGVYSIVGKWICGVHYVENMNVEEHEVKMVPHLTYGILLTEIPALVSVAE